INVNRVPYSTYGTFFDKGDPGGGLVLVSGTFTGPVHTNTHLAFSSKNTVVFRGHVSQSDADIMYDGKSIPIPGDGTKGVVVSDGGFQQRPPVPLPKNNFVQELAVINGSGYAAQGDSSLVDANGRVTPDALASGLSDASGRPAQRSG